MKSKSKYKNKHVYNINNHEFEVDKRYNLTNIVGCGAYGMVCAAKRRQDGKKVAIKKITNVFDDIVDGKRILREILLLRHFNHPNILSIKDILTIPDYDSFDDIYIVSELLDTDLYRVIRSSQKITLEHRQYFIFQILKGLKHIHSAKVIHRDLKPSNILVNVNCNIKICDFGLARGVNPKFQKTPMTEYVVTRWYRAPEILLMATQYTGAIDIWSVGCILAELINRRPLFPGENYVEQIKMIIRVLGKPPPEDYKHITHPDCIEFLSNLKNRNPVPFTKLCPRATPEEIDILQKTLVFNPSKRATAEQLLAHPYFKKLQKTETEKECDSAFFFEYDYQEIEKETLRELLYKQALLFHPKMNQFSSITNNQSSSSGNSLTSSFRKKFF